MLGPRVLTVADVEALADVPPRDVLLARLAGGFQAPLVKAAGLFQAFTRNFAYGLKALIDTMPAEEAVPEASTPEPSAAGGHTEESRSETAAPAARTRSNPTIRARRRRRSPSSRDRAAQAETEETTGEAN